MKPGPLAESAADSVWSDGRGVFLEIRDDSGCRVTADSSVASEERPDLHEGPRVPKLGGFVPFSSCDWPGKLACVVFISGCPWRCHYCHNPHLQTRSKEAGDPSWSDLLAWLDSRRGLLDGVVICGGEPLAEPKLPEMLAQVKAMGFGVALHTGGGYPARLKECLALVDWVGFDVKAPFADYARITRVKGSGEAAMQSLLAVIESGVAFECRTTAHPALLSDDDLLEIGRSLAAAGVSHYAVQKFRPHGCNDAALLADPHAPGYPAGSTLDALRAAFADFSLRAA